MGLFDRKYCDVCGQKIGLLGNRKLEDGNLCKNCAGELSPWFNGRRHATVAEIRDQLAYRKENKARVDAFRATREFGDYGRLLLNEETGEFILLRYGLRLTDNPDVLSLDQIRACELKISHTKLEEKQKNAENRMVSYDPPRHKHTYIFTLVLQVDHPWFDRMQMRYHKKDVVIRTGMPVEMPTVFGINLGTLHTAGEPDTAASADYQETLRLGQEIQRLLLRQEEPLAPVVAEAAENSVVCDYCGETVQPEDGLCPCCGAKLNG